MVVCDPRRETCMAIALFPRGDVDTRDCTSTIAAMKTRSTVSSVKRCPTGFNVGIESSTSLAVA